MASLSLTHLRGKNSVPEFARTRPRTSWARPGRVGFKVFASSEAQAEPDLGVTVNGLRMPNPFVIGSGPPGTNYTVMKRAFDEGWGAVIAKTVSPFCSALFGVISILCVVAEKMYGKKKNKFQL